MVLWVRNLDLHSCTKSSEQTLQGRSQGQTGQALVGGRDPWGSSAGGLQGPCPSWLAGRWLNSVPEAEDRGPSPLLSSPLSRGQPGLLEAAWMNSSSNPWAGLPSSPNLSGFSGKKFSALKGYWIGPRPVWDILLLQGQ